MPKKLKQSSNPVEQTSKVATRKPRKLSPAWVRTKVAVQRSLSPHRSFKATNKHDRPRPTRVPSTWRLIKQTFELFGKAKTVFIGVVLLYLILELLVIGSSTQQDYLGLKDAVAQTFGGNGFAKAGSLLSAVFAGALSPQMTQLQQFLQVLFQFLLFLAVVWIARQVLSGNKPTIAQALYNSPTPFISATLLVVVLLLQLLPAGIGLYVFSIASSGGFLSYAGLALLLGLLVALLITLSLYLIVTTIVGFAIVTIPGMYPLASLSSAKQLVLGRRLKVLFKLIGLAIWLLIVWGIVLLPFLLLDSFTNVEAVPYVPFALQVLAGFSLLFAPLYIYRLYRSLL